MRTTTSPVALLALPALAYAVTLSDFTPRVQDLPAACKKVYLQDISGCTGDDFPDCSKACVNGLAAMTEPVKGACSNLGISGQNIIVAFLEDSGPGSLCTNADSILSSSSSATAASSSQQSSATSQAPSVTSATSEATVSSSTTTASSTTQDSMSADSSSASSLSSATQLSSSDSSDNSATATASSSTAIVVDTSSSPTASETPSSTSSSEDSDQMSLDDNSGGGSPFDTAGNLRSSATRGSFTGLSLVIAFAFAVFTIQR